MITLIIFLFTVVLAIIWHQRNSLKLMWLLPGPIPIPLIGNAIVWMKLSDVLPHLDQIAFTYKGPIRYFYGPQPTVFIFDAENAKIVLNSKDCLNKPEFFYRIFRETVGVDGVATLGAEKWKFHRRLVAPELSLSNTTAHLDTFNRCIRETVRHLPTNEFFDILPQTVMTMMNLLFEASMGKDMEYKYKQEYLQNATDAAKIMTRRMLTPIFRIDFIWKLTKAAKTLLKYQEFGLSLYSKVLKEKSESSDNDNSFMQKLVQMSQKDNRFTHDDIIAEAVTFFAASTDSLALGISFTSVMLALHPEHQEKVYQEVLAIMPEANVDLTQADLDKLEFTDQCITETLRLYPTIPLIGRYSSKPLTLSNGVIIPPNIPFVIGLRQIAIQEKYFGSTSTKFDPNRFADENLKNLPPTANIPFSFGPRNCIGYFYVKVCLKLFIAHLIRNYRLTTSYKSTDDLQLLYNVGLRLVDKHMVKLERRV